MRCFMCSALRCSCCRMHSSSCCRSLLSLSRSASRAFGASSATCSTIGTPRIKSNTGCSTVTCRFSQLPGARGASLLVGRLGFVSAYPHTISAPLVSKYPHMIFAPLPWLNHHVLACPPAACDPHHPFQLVQDHPFQLVHREPCRASVLLSLHCHRCHACT